SFITTGFYMTLEELRGAGIGSKIWNRAMERIRAAKKTFGLRAVPDMYTKYASGDTQVELSRLKKHLLTVDQMKDFCSHYDVSSLGSRLYRELNDNEQRDFIRFDREITGRDRSAWLEKFTTSSTTEISVFVRDGKVEAYAAVSTIGHKSANTVKIGPCFASSVTEFSVLVKLLIPWIEKFSNDANVLIAVLTGSVGERELSPVLGHQMSYELVTLLSESIETKMNLSKCYVPNNAHCHFDA
ncbi:hypothetical protein PFISCL1PPCAC_28839, partial [Pristionchus fissidentatus]